jgi:hypothetical protein
MDYKLLVESIATGPSSEPVKELRELAECIVGKIFRSNTERVIGESSTLSDIDTEICLFRKILVDLRHDIILPVSSIELYETIIHPLHMFIIHRGV